VREELKIYEITNRTTGKKHYSVSDNAQDACKQAGWSIGDCFVHEQKPRRKPVPDHEPLLLVKIPCRVCSYQYAQCANPPGEQCPCRPDTPDLNEWLKQVAKAHLCPHVGKKLAKVDYDLGQKWETIEQAIKDLSPQPSPAPPNP
jgi:hypothetical protein